METHVWDSLEEGIIQCRFDLTMTWYIETSGDARGSPMTSESPPAIGENLRTSNYNLQSGISPQQVGARSQNHMSQNEQYPTIPHFEFVSSAEMI